MALFVWCPVLLAQPADAPPVEKLAYGVRDLTVQIISFHGQNRDDIAAEGYGFVVAQQGDVVMIATADHVVRDPDGAEYGEVRVIFYADQAHCQAATVLDLRLPPAYGDLAVLEVRNPGFRMTQTPVASLPLTQGERAWRIGKQRGWTPGNLPGAFTGTERTIWLGFDNLDTPRGSSGGPIVVEQGLVGMVTDDQSGRALVLPINIIANTFHEKGLPWGLGAPEPANRGPDAQSGANKGERDIPASYAETDATGVRSFQFETPPNEYKAGSRKWVRTAPDVWEENYPDGEKTIYHVVKRIRVGDCDGTVVSKSLDKNFQCFFTDRTCDENSIMFRRLSEGNQWNFYANINDLK